jgi:hypothetical protein
VHTANAHESRTAQLSSVITSKPAMRYHFKTGQRNHTQD